VPFLLSTTTTNTTTTATTVQFYSSSFISMFTTDQAVNLGVVKIKFLQAKSNSWFKEMK